MMFTLLGAPGFVIAGDSDLASSEYNFAINELSKASYNQAAIIGQQGSGNNSDVRQTVLNCCPLFLRRAGITARMLISQGRITLLISIRPATATMRVLSRALLATPP